MKRTLFLLGSIALITISCNRIENNSIFEELTAEEISNLIKKDTIYEKVMTFVEDAREELKEDVVLQGKYYEITYKEFYEIFKKINDTAYVNKIEKLAIAEYNLYRDSMLSLYQYEIDTLYSYFKGKWEESNPSNYMKVEFNGIDKEYYSYGGDVKVVNINFKITPLKGCIQGGVFRYEVIPKVSGKAIGGILNSSHGCRFSSITCVPKIFTWEAPYGIDDEFEYKSSAEVKLKYDFKIDISSVRIKGRNFSGWKDFTWWIDYMNVDSLNQSDYFDLMKDHFNVEIQREWEFSSKLLSKEMSKEFGKAYELMEQIQQASQGELEKMLNEELDKILEEL